MPITLILSPHVDDEILGCGGLIHQRIRSGHMVFVQYFGVDDFHIVSKRDRFHEIANVASFLGFEYGAFDNIVNNYKVHELTTPLANLINKLKPDEIFIPNYSYNQDHNAVRDAAMIALRPHDVNHFVNNVYIYEVDQYQVWGNYSFQPNYFIEIDIDVKINAYLLHASQVRQMRPPAMLKHFAAIRGYSSNVDYAEGFISLRSIIYNK